MSSHEVNQAVQHIQVAPPTNELAELQAFIEAQNITAGTSNNKNKRVREQIILEQNMIKFPDAAVTGNSTSNAQNSAPNPTTTTENPGYSTHSNMVIREPVQYQYIYDPINDVMKRVEKTAGGCLQDVGKGKQCTSYSTGKQKFKAKVSYNYYSTFLLRTLSGTESSNTTATSTQRQSHKDGNSESNCEKSSSATSQVSNTTVRAAVAPSTSECQPEGQPDKGVASVPSSASSSSSEGELSCAFSSDEECTDVRNCVKEKPISSERHAQIDARIQQQKLQVWKGKSGLKGIEDPRESAIKPIHAPKMERMAIAKLKALEARARQAKPNTQGDVVTSIMNDIDNMAEINYSVVVVGAGFRTRKLL